MDERSGDGNVVAAPSSAMDTQADLRPLEVDIHPSISPPQLSEWRGGTPVPPQQQQQQQQQRRYAPLLSLFGPPEDSATAANGDVGGDPVVGDDVPLLSSSSPPPPPPAPQEEQQQQQRQQQQGSFSDGVNRLGDGVAGIRGGVAALRRFLRDVCEACAREVPPASSPRFFSPCDRTKMTRYESVTTYEAESMLYKDHLETRSHEPRWFMWVFVVVLGIATSALSVCVMTCLHMLNSVRYELLGFGLRGFTFADTHRYPHPSDAASSFYSDNSTSTHGGLDTWAMLRGYSVGLYGIDSPRWYWAGYAVWLLYALCTSAIASAVCYLVPQSVGAGVPEVRAYLNGVAYPMMGSTRVLAAKIVAVVFTVASGVCTGHYGHLMLAGAMLGAQLLQRRHGVRCYHVHFVDCFRNPRDRRIILVIGAAAGIAAAFCVSVGGLLVVLELLSAVFPVRFALYVFAACLLSTLFTQVYWSTRMDVDPSSHPHGGLLRREVVVLFRTALPFGQHAAMNLLAFAPALVIGLCSGAFAVVFVRLSWTALYCRRRLEARWRTKTLRYVLPVLFTLVYVSVHYWVAVALTATAADRDSAAAAAPSSSSSSSSAHGGPATRAPAVCRPVPHAVRSGRNVTSIGFYGMNGFLCPSAGAGEPESASSDEAAPSTQLLQPREQTVHVVDAYASLAFSYADSTLQTLLSQRTEHLLPGPALVGFSALYFFASAVYSGIALCGDTMLPSLVIGAAIGRCIGAVAHSVAVASSAQAATWADPGVFALFGAGSFLSATSGLSFGIGAILIESTADFRHLLPLIFAIAVARQVLQRWGRDVHTVYLEARAVPLLNAEPFLERYSLLDARDVMHATVVALPVVCSFRDVVRVLRTTTHHGFPVVSLSDGVFKGLVTRAQLELLLWHVIMTDGRINHCTYDVMQRVEDHVFHNGWEGLDPTQHLRHERLYTDQVSLYPYVDTSAFTVLDTAPLPRTYEMFKTLGLRHLVVVDSSNYAVGMITRKDLVGDHLSAVLDSQDAATRGGGAVLACLRKPLHPSPAQVAEVARQSSTRSLADPRPLPQFPDAQRFSPVREAAPLVYPRGAHIAQAIRRSLLGVPSPLLPTPGSPS